MTVPVTELPMARLPSLRWRANLPADQVLGWLALDGYSFHQAFLLRGGKIGVNPSRLSAGPISGEKELR